MYTVNVFITNDVEFTTDEVHYNNIVKSNRELNITISNIEAEIKTRKAKRKTEKNLQEIDRLQTLLEETKKLVITTVKLSRLRTAILEYLNKRLQIIVDEYQEIIDNMHFGNASHTLKWNFSDIVKLEESGKLVTMLIKLFNFSPDKWNELINEDVMKDYIYTVLSQARRQISQSTSQQSNLVDAAKLEFAAELLDKNTYDDIYHYFIMPMVECGIARKYKAIILLDE